MKTSVSEHEGQASATAGCSVIGKRWACDSNVDQQLARTRPTFLVSPVSSASRRRTASLQGYQASIRRQPAPLHTPAYSTVVTLETLPQRRSAPTLNCASVIYRMNAMKLDQENHHLATVETDRDSLLQLR